MEKPRRAEIIAAPATPRGYGGVGVVRVSGPDLAALTESILGQIPRARHATVSSFLDAEGNAIDHGIALFYPKPHSYTGEDVLELQGHGGPMVMALVLERCIELNARLAEPGEFTKRAFLNDKLDLTQAEAVADLIEATTASAARSALRSLTGAFSEEVHRLIRELIELRALMEASLDFPEEEIDYLRDSDAHGRLAALVGRVESILGRAKQGSLLRTGMQVVLVGPPNVGKSSLLNRLAGEERAIVTPFAGTTRDALREVIQVEGIPLHIIDTAGLRDTTDEVERIGVSRTWKEIEKADVVVQMVDARDGLNAEDHRIGGSIAHGVTRLIVLNKADLANAAASREEIETGVRLTLSAKTGEGVELLESELLRIAGWKADAEDVIMARTRHLNALASAYEHLSCAGRNLQQIELAAEELRLAQKALRAISGEFSADDLLGEIFSRFCIGK